MPSQAADVEPESRLATAADVSAVAWTPRDEMDREQWLTAGRKLGVIGRSSQWWIGDWVRYGNVKWGEKYTEAARITGYDAASLRNMAWVSSQFEPSLRSDKLSWSHHVLLAPLEEDEKRQWLQRAVSDSLSVAALRDGLRGDDEATGEEADAPDPATDESPLTPNTRLTCPECGHQIALPEP